MRKEKEITIEKGRDAGKKFKIVEMSATMTDRWATRALLVLGKSIKGGITALSTLSMEDILAGLSNASFEDCEPLLQELLECSYFLKDGTSVQLKKDFVDGIIEDISTLWTLRVEALHLHLDFLEQGDGLGSK